MLMPRLSARALGVVAPLSFALSLGAAGCGSAPSTDPIGDTAEAIQDGVVDNGDADVGLLLRPANTNGSWDGGGICTGTLIAPNLVLTAAHCLDKQAPYPLTSGMTKFYLGTGTPQSTAVSAQEPASMTEFDIVDYRMHPSYDRNSLAANDAYDVGVVLLSRPAKGVAVATYATSASDDPPVNAIGTAVGFGVTSGPWGSGTAMQKRTGTEVVSAVPKLGAPMFSLTESTGLADRGDSGGPLFYNGKIVATVAGHDDDHNGGLHRLEYYVPLSPLASDIATMVSQLRLSCESNICSPISVCDDWDISRNTCFCIAAEYRCYRNLCAESRPIISCHVGF
jgi:hypothetical protein